MHRNLRASSAILLGLATLGGVTFVIGSSSTSVAADSPIRTLLGL